MTYPVRTLLRYHCASGTHHSALVLEGGRLLQVKRASQPVKEEVESVEAWLAGMPEKPSVDELEVILPVEEAVEAVEAVVEEEKKGDEQAETGKKKGKGKKETKDKKEAKDNVPELLLPPSNITTSLEWVHHLHRTMKEANPALLRRVDVVTAFNTLVQYMMDHQTHIVTHVPAWNNRYREGVDIDKNPADYPLRGMCTIHMNSVSRNLNTGHLAIRFPYHYPNLRHPIELTDEERRIRDGIVERYRVWFALVREEILPYMKEKCDVVDKRIRDKQIERIVQRMQKLQARHDREVERRRAGIQALEERHQQALGRHHYMIAALANVEKEEKK